MRHRIVIIGGGSAGISIAARLQRAGQDDIAVIEPSDTHYYQPLWTLVGGGASSLERSRRSETSVMPKGVRWIQDKAVEVDPDQRQVAILSGAKISYDFLVVCPGLELAWDMVPGLEEAVRSTPFASTNYVAELAPKTWDLVSKFRGGTALFASPGTPIKCPGAPQKAAYLSADHWQRNGTLANTEVVFATGAGGIFGVPEFAAVLSSVIERYGIDAKFSHELIEVDPGKRSALFEITTPEGKKRESITYDILHTAPPQRAPEFIREGPLADPSNPFGWVSVDKHTLQHTAYPEIFSLGDVCSAPASKTGAAIRKEAPVVVTNLLSAINGKEPSAQYDGYAACPFTTARGKMLLAEFDYTLKPHPTIPVINTKKERADMWLLKKYGLPFFYWNFMLRGLG